MENQSHTSDSNLFRDLGSYSWIDRPASLMAPYVRGSQCNILRLSHLVSPFFRKKIIFDSLPGTRIRLSHRVLVRTIFFRRLSRQSVCRLGTGQRFTDLDISIPTD